MAKYTSILQVNKAKEKNKDGKDNFYVRLNYDTTVKIGNRTVSLPKGSLVSLFDPRQRLSPEQRAELEATGQTSFKIGSFEKKVYASTKYDGCIKEE